MAKEIFRALKARLFPGAGRHPESIDKSSGFLLDGNVVPIDYTYLLDLGSEQSLSLKVEKNALTITDAQFFFEDRIRGSAIQIWYPLEEIDRHDSQTDVPVLEQKARKHSSRISDAREYDVLTYPRVGEPRMFLDVSKNELTWTDNEGELHRITFQQS